ncbi:flagellin [Sulfitobacter sp. S0837]|uniref:flagellin n=1 Tax=Sulfitobacter maritimus TaxID=2741719 RepID=UPI0015833B1F|nr:flagellin [Sulfitobacter maritimus]NUH64959.1 flagellin [Sulfitobacter maritimus]
MSSINTNTSAMNALSTLRNVNSSLNQTQDRISTGLKVSSGKDNASYFAISETMKGDSGMTKAVNESLTLTKNSIATARVGAEQFSALATEFREKVAFAQNSESGFDKIQDELTNLVAEMATTISQSTFNGDDLVNAAGTAKKDNAATPADVTVVLDTQTGALSYSGTGVISDDATTSREVVTGVTRSGSFSTTSIDVNSVNLHDMYEKFDALATNFAAYAVGNHDADDGTTAALATGPAFLKGALASADTIVADAVNATTSLGLAEKSIENQQDFLTKLSDNLDAGVGAMVDANMEEEAARLQALQVQQQLASQSLSIANQAPQNILSLFR